MMQQQSVLKITDEANNNENVAEIARLAIRYKIIEA